MISVIRIIFYHDLTLIVLIVHLDGQKFEIFLFNFNMYISELFLVLIILYGPKTKKGVTAAKI